MTPADTRRLVGQLLVTGFDGPTLSAHSQRALAQGERAGVILFRRNLPDLSSMSALTSAIQQAAAGELPALIAIDEEGGRVSRLPAAELRLPPMRSLAARDVAVVHEAGAALGYELSRLGVNLDFAPVLDVDSNPDNPVIGDRSFSRDPAAVARLGLAFAEGLCQGGVLACGKHFPGHGDTDKDSHFDLPTIKHGRARLDRVELVPFAEAAKRGLDSLMSAHLVVESLSGTEVATFSRAVMTDLLRDQLGFRGVLFSDDLEMKAVSATTAVAEAAVRAVAAGCDAVLVCKDEDLADQALDGLAREVEKSSAFLARAQEAHARVRALRRTAAERRATPPRRPLLELIRDLGASP